MRPIYFGIFTVLLAASLFAQVEPEGAESMLYVPSVTVGQSGNTFTSTELTFQNPNTTSPARVTLLFFGDDGQPWPLDFGGGPIVEGGFEVPAQGRRSFQAVRSSRTNTGWLAMFSTVPIQMTVVLKQIIGQRVMNTTSYPASMPSTFYQVAAREDQEFCVSNPLGTVARLVVDTVDSEGATLRSTGITLRPMQRNCFRPRVLIPTLPPGVLGSISIKSAPGSIDPFIAEHHIVDGNGYWNVSPSGRTRWPIAHEERIYSTFLRLWATAKTIAAFPDTSKMPDLQILRNRNINAYAEGGHTVAIEIGLSQLISDSPSELAFVIGHEIGHIFQQRARSFRFDSRSEYDADFWGAVLSIGAGYDPYAIAGALAKLSMASGRSGLISQFEDELSGDNIHKSFNERLSNVFEMLQFVCSLPQMNSECAKYKSQFHPNLPTGAPLNVPGARPSESESASPIRLSLRPAILNMTSLPERPLMVK